MSFKQLKKIYSILNNEERKKLFTIFFLIIIGMLFETFGIALILPFLNILSDSHFFSNYPQVKEIFLNMNITNEKDMLITILVCFFIFYLVKNVYLIFLSWKQTDFSNELLKNISTRLYKKYLFQPYLFHLNNNSSTLVKNIIAETFSFGKFNIQTTISLFSELTILFGIFILLIIIEPLITTILILIVLFISFVYLFLTKKKIIEWGKERQSVDSARYKVLQESLGGYKTVSLSNYENNFLEIYTKETTKSTNFAKKINFVGDLPKFIIELTFISLFVLTAIIVVLNSGNLQNIINTIAFFAMAAFRIMPATNRIIYAIQNFKYGNSILELLYNDLTELKEINKIQSKKELIFNKVLSINNLTFEYKKNTPILKKINMKIHKGSFIGFIGESGAGKSTMVDLILGLLEPSSGSIKIDDKNIIEYLSSWQKKIGYVPQSIFLSDDTLKNNIAFGLNEKEIDENKVIQVLKEAQLYEYVSNLEDGIETIVGESGVNFSGGQRQRIGIARALYNNPEILILDEATSALDTQTEAEIIKLINNIHGNKTIISIAHRLTTVAQCDIIYKFKNGKIIDFGSPQEIIGDKNE